jgi:PAS domain S-box-containing protein
MPPLTLSQYERLWNISEIPMAVVALDHRFIRCNRSYCTLTGYAESELLARRWPQITHPDDVDGDVASAGGLACDAESDGYSLTKRYIRKCGKSITVQISVLAIRDDQGRLDGYFVTAIPIEAESIQPAREPFSLLRWAAQHPKDTAIVVLGGGLILGRDTLIDLIKFWLTK